MLIIEGVDWQSQKLLPPYFVIKYTAMKVRVVDSTRFLLTLNSLIDNTCTLLNLLSCDVSESCISGTSNFRRNE